MHLAHREVVELEGELRRQVRVWFLPGQELYVEADRRGSGLVGAAICCLHQPGAAASRDNVVTKASVQTERTASLGDDPPESSGLSIPAALRGRPVRAHACAAEHHDGGTNPPRPERLLGLPILEEEAHAAHRVAQQEGLVERWEAIGRRSELGAVARAVVA